MSRSWKLWASEVNARGGISIANQLYRVNITEFDIGGSFDITYNRTLEIAIGPGAGMDFFFGPVGADSHIAASLALKSFDKVLIGGYVLSQAAFVCPTATSIGCTKAGERVSANTFASMPTAEIFFGPGLNLFVVAGARTIAIFAEEGVYIQSTVSSAVQAANEYGIQIVFKRTVPRDMSDEQTEALVNELAQLNPDIVFGSQFESSTISFVRAMKKLNYSPKAVSLRIVNMHIPPSMAEDFRYISDVRVFDERRPGGSAELYFTDQPASLPIAKKFANAVRKAFPEFASEPIASEAVYFEQGEVLHRALLAAQSTSPAAVRKALYTLSFDSIFGQVGFNPFGMNDKTVAVTIQQDATGQAQIIAPIGATTAKVIYPFPPWDERTQRLGAYTGNNAEFGILGFNVALVIYSLVLIAVVLSKWTHPVVFNAQPQYLLLLLIGSTMGYLGVIVWPLQTNSTQMCQSIPWLLGGGFALVFVAIFARIYGLTQQFTMPKSAQMSDRHLDLGLGSLIGVGVVLLLFWQSIAPIQAVVVSPDPLRPGQDYLECQLHPDSGSTFLGILLAYSFLLICIAGVMAIRIWNLKFEVFNESKHLGFAIYNLLFFLTLTVAISSVLSSAMQELSYILRSVCIDLGILLTSSALVLPKLITISSNPMLKRWGSSDASGAALSSQSETSLPVAKTKGCSKHIASQINAEAYIFRLKAQIRELKAELLALRKDRRPEDFGPVPVVSSTSSIDLGVSNGYE